MARQTTPTFVAEIPLMANSNDLAVLAARLEAGRQLYNTALSEAKKRLSLVRHSELYAEAKAIPKVNFSFSSEKQDFSDEKDKFQKQARSDAFSLAKKAHRYTDYDLQVEANQTAIASIWIKEHLDTHTIQKIGTRAFKATERMLFGKAKVQSTRKFSI